MALNSLKLSWPAWRFRSASRSQAGRAQLPTTVTGKSGVCVPMVEPPQNSCRAGPVCFAIPRPRSPATFDVTDRSMPSRLRQIGSGAPFRPRGVVVPDPGIPQEPQRQIRVGRAQAGVAVRHDLLLLAHAEPQEIGPELIGLAKRLVRAQGQGPIPGPVPSA